MLVSLERYVFSVINRLVMICASICIAISPVKLVSSAGATLVEEMQARHRGRMHRRALHSSDVTKRSTMSGSLVASELLISLSTSRVRKACPRSLGVPIRTISCTSFRTQHLGRKRWIFDIGTIPGRTVAIFLVGTKLRSSASRHQCVFSSTSGVLQTGRTSLNAAAC